MRRIAILCVLCLLITGAAASGAPLISSWSTDSSANKTSATSRVHLRRKPAAGHSGSEQSHVHRGTARRSHGSGGAPVILLGEQALEPTISDNLVGTVDAFAFRAHRSGTAASISVYLVRRTRATTLFAGLYSSSHGRPHSLMTSGLLQSPKAGAWNSVAVRSARLQSGKRYWLAVLGTGGAIDFRDRDGGLCTGERSSKRRLRSLPGTWPAGSQSRVCGISAYVKGLSNGGTTVFGTNAPTGTTGTASGTTASPTNTAPPTSGTDVTLPPLATGGPTISGSPVVGQTLTTSDGSWTDSPTSYGYQWEDCDNSGGSCVSISGATSSSYTLRAGDVGDTVRVVVTATNGGGWTPAMSAATSVVTAPPAPSNTALPSISGQAVQGQALTTSNGLWSGSPASYGYQWEDCDNSGGSCVSISGATSSSYTLRAGDVGDTVRVVVTATNAGGSTPATSAQTAAVASPPTGPLACNLNATTSNFAVQIASATAGQVVCLASGDYSSFTGTSKSAPGITITSAPGATVTFNSGFKLNLSSVQNFTLDGSGGGGTMTVGGELDMETSGGALQNKALNLLFQNIAFTATADVTIDGPENSNITFNRDTFVAGNVACSGGSPVGTTWEFLLSYRTATATTPSGVTVENSVFVAPADLWDPARAIQTASSMTAANNVFVGYVAHSDAAGCNHIDTLQIFSQTNGTWGGVAFTGNLCYFDYGCIMAFDGTSDNTITDNVCFDIERSCATLYSDSGSVVSHNTQQKGGTAASLGCIDAVACTSGDVFENSHKTGDSVGSGETFSNNISGSTPNIGDSSAVSTNTNNLYSGSSSPNINGSATFTGGTNPITWAGFELTSGSTGHSAGSDGLDVGIRGSAGGPPTGGGSAPANTAAPALTGTATQGQTLTTTNGTWTITGNVPTVTTYQWFDCPTSTFSAGSCTPIQPQTAPNSANTSIYTLQASDVGDYIFSEVTVTNANGQINATSNAIGPVVG